MPSSVLRHCVHTFGGLGGHTTSPPLGTKPLGLKRNALRVIHLLFVNHSPSGLHFQQGVLETSPHFEKHTHFRQYQVQKLHLRISSE